MIKKYIILSASLLFFPLYAGRIVLVDGELFDIPDVLRIRHDVAQLGEIILFGAKFRGEFAILKGKEYIRFNENFSWFVNFKADRKHEKGELPIKIAGKKHSLFYPVWLSIRKKDKDGFLEEEREFRYRLSDIIANKLDRDGFTVQDK